VRGDVLGRLGLLRGGVLAALSTLLTAAGHVAGGGSLPDLALLVVLVPMLAGVLASVARRCTSAGSAVLTLAAGQLALHHLLVLMHPSHQETGPAVLTGAAMVPMHAVATLVTAVMVRTADRALVALVGALRRVLPRRPVPPPADRPLPILAVPAPAVPTRLRLAHSAPLLRRGPPVTC
jgi:hypothetical protein